MIVSPLSANRQIARAAGTIMAAFVLSNLTGLFRQILILRAFGTENVLDAFNAASTYTDLLFSLIAGGALASAFVPTFTAFLARDERKNAWLLASALINLVLLILCLTSLVSLFFSRQLVGTILAPKFSPSLQDLTASLLRILLIAPAIFGVSGLLMGILNAHQVFIWPALAPTMYWLGMIAGVLFLTPSMGIYGLAWGAVLGAGMHLLVQVPAVLKLPARRFILTLGLRFSPVGQVARLMAPRLLGVAAVQINFVVNTILATGQPEGSLTAIKSAWAVMTMPQVVIAQAIAIAALPTFSAQAARGELVQMRRSLAGTLRGVIFLSLPASIGLVLLRAPIVSLLFERGKFDPHSSQLVAWALLWYAAGLVGHSLVEIVSRAFYALQDTKTPVLVGAAAMSLNVLFSLVFSAFFDRVGWMPHGGLALANSLATTLEMAVLLYLMRRRLDGLEGKLLLSGSAQAVLATLVMSLALGLWLGWSHDLSAWVTGGIGVVVGGAVYAAGILVLRVPEARELLSLLPMRKH